MKFKLNKYAKFFKPKDFLSFLASKIKVVGTSIAYAGLLMFYAFREEETPSWAKKIIVGTLGYVITPIDILPDITPVVGYTDDLGMLSFGLVAISCYINDDIKLKAKEKIRTWLGKEPDPETFDVIDAKL